jgi:hypothetical protein
MVRQPIAVRVAIDFAAHERCGIVELFHLAQPLRRFPGSIRRQVQQRLLGRQRFDAAAIRRAREQLPAQRQRHLFIELIRIETLLHHALQRAHRASRERRLSRRLVA